MENKNMIRLLVAVVIIGAVILAAVLISCSASRQVLGPNSSSEEAQLVAGGSYSAADRAVFEAFLRKNLSELSPEKEVLGGTFYLTNIVWITDRNAIIDYEDGHIALRASVGFSFTDKNRIEPQTDYFIMIPVGSIPVEGLSGIIQEEPLIEDYLEPINQAPIIEEYLPTEVKEMPTY